MKILVTGQSGLIGMALTRHFESRGSTVVPLVRGVRDQPFCWQPEQGFIHLDEQAPIDAVINLAGPGIADRRWSENRKAVIHDTRVEATALLAEALASRSRKPAVLLSASAIGFYGPRDSEPVDETSSSGTGFLARVARDWEAATRPAQEAGIRTVLMRFGVVLSKHGGALEQMLLPFRLGLGGVIGSGRQYMSWVGLADLVSMVQFLIDQPAVAGPVNLVAPNPVTNREFTKTLARALSRPALLPMPAWLCRLVFGEMAEELLLTGVKVTPAKLTGLGYHFKQPELAAALRTEFRDGN